MELDKGKMSGCGSEPIKSNHFLKIIAPINVPSKTSIFPAGLSLLM